MPYCASCGADVAGVRFCPKCGAPVTAGDAPPSGGAAPGPGGYGAAGPAPAAGGSYAASSSEGGLSDNVAGALAYFTIIPAILFLVIDPFKTRRFVRFHSFQSLFFNGAVLILWFAVMFVGAISSFIGIGIMLWALWFLFEIGLFVVWLLVVIKAYQNQEFKLPVIGDLAAKQV